MCVCVCESRFGVAFAVFIWSGGVRQISWCVTGAIKVVALDTAHEQHNDSRLVLISLHLAPSSVLAGSAARLRSELMKRGGEHSCITPTGKR